MAPQGPLGVLYIHRSHLKFAKSLAQHFKYKTHFCQQPPGFLFLRFSGKGHTEMDPTHVTECFLRVEPCWIQHLQFLYLKACFRNRNLPYIHFNRELA